MIRTKGEPGTGDIVQAVRHMRMMNSEIAKLTSMREDELFEAAKQLQVPYELVAYVHENGKLPVVNFGRRCSYTGRCSTYDAAWSRRCICWIWYFQVWKSGKKSIRNCTGGDKLYRCKTDCRAFKRPRRSHGRN